MPTQSYDIPKCLLCGKRGVESAHATKSLDLSKAHPKRHIFFCKDCDFYWLWPQLTTEEKVNLYGNSYFEDTIRNYSYEAQTAECELCFLETAMEIAKIIPKGGTILDVGCADGRFLEICEKQGLRATGVEFSESAALAAKSRGLEVFVGDINHEGIAQRQFDAIHLSHVLEHLDTPIMVVEKLHALLKEGGLLYIEVPRQFDSWLERLNAARGRFHEFGPFSLHHSCFFSPRSLSKLLANQGFRVESLTTARTCKRAKRKGWNSFLAQTFINFSSLFSKGDLVCVYAIKSH